MHFGANCTSYFNGFIKDIFLFAKFNYFALFDCFFKIFSGLRVFYAYQPFHIIIGHFLLFDLVLAVILVLVYLTECLFDCF